jgi:hypothetical protein
MLIRQSKRRWMRINLMKGTSTIEDIKRHNLLGAVYCLDKHPEQIQIKCNGRYWTMETDEYQGAHGDLSDLLIDWMFKTSF